MRSWLLYIPAGLIEIHPHMEDQLATINKSWDSSLDKNHNLVYIRTYGRETRMLYAPNGPRQRGHIQIKLLPTTQVLHFQVCQYITCMASVVVHECCCCGESLVSTYLTREWNVLILLLALQLTDKFQCQFLWKNNWFVYWILMFWSNFLLFFLQNTSIWKNCEWLINWIHTTERSIYEPPHDKTNTMTVHPAKTQISLGISPVWSESSLCT